MYSGDLCLVVHTFSIFNSLYTDVILYSSFSFFMIVLSGNLRSPVTQLLHSLPKFLLCSIRDVELSTLYDLTLLLLGPSLGSDKFTFDPSYQSVLLSYPRSNVLGWRSHLNSHRTFHLVNFFLWLNWFQVSFYWVFLLLLVNTSNRGARFLLHYS